VAPQAQEQEERVSKGAKLAYRPVGLAGGILAGLVSGAVFKQVWKFVAKEDDAPSALQSEYRMREVVLAAAIQGALFAATKAAVDRAGARAFTKMTGAWPGD
jgi:predicted metal-dependent enzyme (double-stranded beta helix superfamily)